MRTYTAWNGREYPWPPPERWEQRSDGRYWPIGDGGTGGPDGGAFAPRSAAGERYALASQLAPPRREQRYGPTPMPRRGMAALVVGVVAALWSTQFVSYDILGFTISPSDLELVQDGAEQGPIQDLGEERELSAETIAELLTIDECVNEGDGARLDGTVWNPLEGERTYLITARFVVDGERQLDGLTEVVVPPGVTSSFSAFSASPAVDGVAECSFGDVFRFIAN